VPDFFGRYYSVQFTDPWNIDFAYVGTRETGTQAGDYLVTGLRATTWGSNEIAPTASRAS
jgi:hypothetical protein